MKQAFHDAIYRTITNVLTDPELTFRYVRSREFFSTRRVTDVVPVYEATLPDGGKLLCEFGLHSDRGTTLTFNSDEEQQARIDSKEDLEMTLQVFGSRTELDDGPLALNLREIVLSIIDAARHAKGQTFGVNLAQFRLPTVTTWTAELDLGIGVEHAYGSTPEEAMENLDLAWRRHVAVICSVSPEAVREKRDEVRVYPLGSHSALPIEDETIMGSDERFDEVLQSNTPKFQR